MKQELLEKLREVFAELLYEEGGPTLRQLGGLYMLAALKSCGGDKTKAAKRLAIARRTFYNRGISWDPTLEPAAPTVKE